MFGKAEWFRPAKSRIGIAPDTWQGWLYAGVWLGGLLLPAVVLLGQVKVVEMLVWLGVAGGLLTFDLLQLKRQLAGGKAADDDVLYIGDNETESERIATRNFDLRSRG